MVCFEYQSFVQPIIKTPFKEGKGWYQCNSYCENLRAINIGFNIFVLILSMAHYFIRYRNAVFEGIDYIAEK